MSQSIELSLPAPAPACYATEAELTESLQRKGTPEPGRGLYPRDGTVEVTEIESAISELTIPEQRLNVIVSSGMAAVSGTVGFGLSKRGEERGKPPVLAYSNNLYPQSIKSFMHLRHMGVSTAPFPAGESDSIVNLLNQDRADVIMAETVANTPSMPVLDVHGLLDTARSREGDSPILVLDNTLPLSTGLDFEELLTPEDRVLVIESATKSAMHNSENLGVVYSKNEALMDEFRRYKATQGLVTSTRADAAILQTLELTSPGFHERNRALYESTGRIATALARAQEALGAAADFTVEFPTFLEHPNSSYANEHLPDGGSPVVFLQCADFSQDAARTLLKRIAEHPAVEQQIDEGQVFFGQSFGFKEARLLYDPNACQVRISGGYDIDSDALAGALSQATTGR